MNKKKAMEAKKKTENEIVMAAAVKAAHEANPASDDDDVEHYRKEVGEEPDPGIILEQPLTNQTNNKLNIYCL